MKLASRLLSAREVIRVSVNIGFSVNELKNMWTLADTVLRNDNLYYICMECKIAEFDDIN